MTKKGRSGCMVLVAGLVLAALAPAVGAGATAKSTADNRALIGRWSSDEGWLADDVGDRIDVFFAPGVIIHSPGGRTLAERGPDGLKQGIVAFRAAFSEIEIEIHAIIAEGDLVVARSTMSAIHTGPFLGAAPTRTRMSWTVANTFRVEDGRIAEVWEQWDELGFYQQLGLLPRLRAPAE